MRVRGIYEKMKKINGHVKVVKELLKKTNI